MTKIEILDLKVIFLATSLFIVDDIRNVRPILSSVHPVMLATILEIGVRRLLSSISVINIDVADFIIYFMRTYDSYWPQIDRLTVIDVCYEVDYQITGELDLTAVHPRFITKLVLKHH